MNRTLFGLPEKVEHCSKCLLTNQKPFSVNETKNSKGSKKKGLQFKKRAFSSFKTFFTFFLGKKLFEFP